VIPRTFHFVFGLREQYEPFHFAHYVAIESCRRTANPDVIYFHYQHRPWGPWWDRVEPYLVLKEIEPVSEVLMADYSRGLVPTSYRYAHHADFIRLDALIEHGGVYVDIDTVSLGSPRTELFDHPFVIGAEPPVVDEVTGVVRPSLCNALLMSAPGSAFALAWRKRMGSSLNGTWSNHSGFLAQELTEEMPNDVHVEPVATFFPFGSDRAGVAALLEEHHEVPAISTSVHLWAHLWWERARRDFSVAHAGWCTPSGIRGARSTFAELARPYLLEEGPVGSTAPWSYLSLDEASGYGEAADRCRLALEASGIGIEWTPFVPGHGFGNGLGYEPAAPYRPLRTWSGDDVVVVHLVPEYLPPVREHAPDALVVAHTAWETDRVPAAWLACLQSSDVVVVPSDFSAAAFSAAGMLSPAVVPHVAPQPLSEAADGWGDLPDHVFVFYTIAEWTERKGVHLTIEAYLRAFSSSDAVVLVVKTSHRDRRCAPPAGRRAVEPGTSAWSLAAQLASHRNPPSVRLITREVGGAELRSLHRRGDCYVSVCRGEGWGLGAFDAALYGKPVVTTGYGGHMDYLGGSPFLIDFALVSVDDPMGRPSYGPDQQWAEPDVDHAAHLLREVWDRRRVASASAESQVDSLRSRYAPEVVARSFRAVVEGALADRRGVRSSSHDTSGA